MDPRSTPALRLADCTSLRGSTAHFLLHAKQGRSTNRGVFARAQKLTTPTTPRAARTAGVVGSQPETLFARKRVTTYLSPAHLFAATAFVSATSTTAP